MKDFASRPATDAQWKALMKAAAKLPAPKVTLDVSDPAFANPTSMRAAIDAHLRKRKVTPPRELAAYLRLITESLGQGHASVMRSLAGMTGKQFKRILVVGGGSRNGLMCQATADAAGLPVISFNLEGTAVGNIARQLIALGEVADLASFRASLARRLERVEYAPRA